MKNEKKLTFEELEDDFINGITKANQFVNYQDDQKILYDITELEDDEEYFDALDYVYEDKSKQNGQRNLKESKSIISSALGFFNNFYKRIKKTYNDPEEALEDIYKYAKNLISNKKNIEKLELIVNGDIGSLLIQLKRYRDIGISKLSYNLSTLDEETSKFNDDPEFISVQEEKEYKISLKPEDFENLNKDKLNLLSRKNWESLDGRQLSQVLDIMERKDFQATDAEIFYYINKFQDRFMAIEKEIKEWEEVNKPHIWKRAWWNLKHNFKKPWKPLSSWFAGRGSEAFFGKTVGAVVNVFTNLIQGDDESETEINAKMLKKEKKEKKTEWKRIKREMVDKKEPIEEKEKPKIKLDFNQKTPK
jgi:hypothetical protein